MSANAISIRILAVDDHALFREGIATLLAVQPDMNLVAQASNGEQAIDLFRTHRPDITLMDLQLPDMSGIDTAAAICAVDLRKVRPDLPIYLFSGSEDPVGQKLEGVQILITRYRNAGIHDISHDFYPGGRHEMLNEINRNEVVSNMLSWIDTVLERHNR